MPLRLAWGIQHQTLHVLQKFGQPSPQTLQVTTRILVNQDTVGLDDCDLWTDREINDLWDTVKHESLPSTKAEKERNEKAAGFNIYNRDVLLANEQSRRILPVSKVFFDTMHLYFSKRNMQLGNRAFQQCYG